MTDLQKEAEKELARVARIIESIELVNSNGSELLNLIRSYYEDAQYFYREKKFLQAFEAAVICWAYADAGMHLGTFKVAEELRKLFTV